MPYEFYWWPAASLLGHEQARPRKPTLSRFPRISSSSTYRTVRSSILCSLRPIPLHPTIPQLSVIRMREILLCGRATTWQRRHSDIRLRDHLKPSRMYGGPCGGSANCSTLRRPTFWRDVLLLQTHLMQQQSNSRKVDTEFITTNWEIVLTSGLGTRRETNTPA